jgi:hypothetical protein
VDSTEVAERVARIRQLIDDVDNLIARAGVSDEGGTVTDDWRQRLRVLLANEAPGRLAQLADLESEAAGLRKYLVGVREESLNRSDLPPRPPSS